RVQGQVPLGQERLLTLHRWHRPLCRALPPPAAAPAAQDAPPSLPAHPRYFHQHRPCGPVWARMEAMGKFRCLPHSNAIHSAPTHHLFPCNPPYLPAALSLAAPFALLPCMAP
ncbi:unnamed protein product, partial [Closterium sp. NIES-64]